jgi:hypothetical protein
MEFTFSMDQLEEEETPIVPPSLDKPDPLDGPIVIPAKLETSTANRKRSVSFGETKKRSGSDAGSLGMRSLLTSLGQAAGRFTKPISPSAPATPISLNSASPNSNSSVAPSPTPSMSRTTLPHARSQLSLPVQGLGIQNVPATATETPTNYATASEALRLMQAGGTVIPEGGVAYTTVMEDLFTEFILLSEDLIRLAMQGDRERDITHLARPGQDLKFDTCIQNFGIFGAYHPKLAIDSLMTWRRVQLDQCSEDERARKAKLVDVLLMRAMIKVLKATTIDVIDADYLEKVELLVFHRVQAVEPEVRALNRQVHWELYAQCMGVISQLHNGPILRMYSQEMAKLSKDVRFAGFVHAVGYLRLKMYPQEALDESAEFVKSLGLAFQNTHGSKNKIAFAEALVELLEPTGAVASVEVNIPNWQRAVETSWPKAMKMMAKARYYNVALPLITSLLSVASYTFVMQQWQLVVEQTIPKLFKEKTASMRRFALDCMVRLLWIHLFRSPSTFTSTVIQQRLNSFFKILFPKGREVCPQETPGVGEPLYLAVYFVGNRYFDYAMEHLILPLLTEVVPSTILAASGTIASRMSSTSFFTTTEDPIINLESQFAPDRMVIALRAFYLMLRDLEVAAINANGPPVATASQLLVSSGVRSSFSGTKVPVSAPMYPPLLDVVSAQALVGPTALASPFSRTPLGEPWDFLRRSYLSVVELQAHSRVERGWTESKMRSSSQKRHGKSGSDSDFLRRSDDKSTLLCNDYIPQSVQKKMGTSVKEAMERVSEEAMHILNTMEPVLADLMFGLADPNPTAVVFNTPTTPDMAPKHAFGFSKPNPQRRASVGESEPDIYASDSAFLQFSQPTPGSKQLQSLFELTRACIDGFPRLSCKGVGTARLIRLLAKLTLNVDEGVRKSAADALIRIGNIESTDGDWNAPEAGDGALPPCPTNTLAAYVEKVLLETIVNFVNDHPGELTQLQDLDAWQSSLSVVNNLSERWQMQVVRRFPQSANLTFVFLETVSLLLLASSNTVLRGAGINLSKTAHQLAALAQVDPSLGHLYNILNDRGLKIVQQHYVDPELLGNRPLSEAERAQHLLRRQQLDQSPQALMEVATSTDKYDVAIWLRCWPNFFSVAWRDCSRHATQGCSNAVARRLEALTPVVFAMTDIGGSSTSSSYRFLPSFRVQVPGTPSPTIGNWLNHAATLSLAHEDLVAEWRNVLVMGCVSASPDVSQLSMAFAPGPSMTRPPSRGSFTDLPTVSMSSKNMFQSTLPLLSCDKALIRFATVAAFAKIPATCFATFYNEVAPFMKGVTEEGSARLSMGTAHSNMASTSSYFRSPAMAARRLGSMVTFSQPSNPNMLQGPIVGRRADRLRSELLHLFSHLAVLLAYPGARHDGDSIAVGIAQFIVDVARLLADPANLAYDLDALQLRIYFSELVNNFFKAINETHVVFERDVTPLLMSVELRHDLYRLLAAWCGFGPQFQLWRENQFRWRSQFTEGLKDYRDKDPWNLTFDEQLKTLAEESFEAMVTLCRGPMTERDTSESVCFSFPLHGHGSDSRLDGLGDAVHGLSGSLGVRDGLMVRPFNLENVISLFDEACAQVWDPNMASLASDAVMHILANNFQATGVLEDVIRRCYINRSSEASASYFSALTRAVVQNAKFPLPPARGLVLGLLKMTDPVFSVRLNATKLLDCLEKRLSISLTDSTYEKVASTASLSSIVTFGADMACTRLSRMFPRLSNDFISEITFWCESFSADARRGGVGSPMTAQVTSLGTMDRSLRVLLSLSFPWLRNCSLSAEVVALQLFGHAKITLQHTEYSRQLIETLLSNMVVLTFRFGDAYPKEIENMWVNLVDSTDDIAVHVEENVRACIQFVLDLGIRTRNSAIVPLLKMIVLMLSRTPACAWTFETLIQQLDPVGFTPKKTIPDVVSDQAQFPKLYRANTQLVLEPMLRRPALSYGQLAFAGLVDVILELGPQNVLQSLPLLLHVAIVHVDHFAEWFANQCRLLLVQLIDLLLPLDNNLAKDRTLVIRQALAKDLWEANMAMGTPGSTGTTGLSLGATPRLWQYEDISQNRIKVESTEVLSNMVLQLEAIFSIVYPGVGQVWGDVALHWSIYSPARHVTARSLQVFRALMPAMSKEQLGGLLFRLSRIVGDAEDSQGLTLEVLESLQAIVASMDVVQLYHTPALVWASIAGLTTSNRWEYLEFLKLLDLTMKLDFNDSIVTQALQATGFTRTWYEPFEGLLPLLTMGMAFSETEPLALSLVYRLMSVKDDWLIAKGLLRSLATLMCCLPRLMEHADSNHLQQLVSYLGQRGLAELARLIAALGNPNRIYRNMDEWLRHFAVGVKDVFFPTFEMETLGFLISLLGNTTDLYKRQVLALLRALGPHLTQSLVTSYGQGVLEPMLDLLRADQSQEVNDVFGLMVDRTTRQGRGMTTLPVKLLFSPATMLSISQQSKPLKRPHSSKSVACRHDLAVLALSLQPASTVPGLEAHNRQGSDVSQEEPVEKALEGVTQLQVSHSFVLSEENFDAPSIRPRSIASTTDESII